jgi:hypothetical protein
LRWPRLLHANPLKPEDSQVHRENARENASENVCQSRLGTAAEAGGENVARDASRSTTHGHADSPAGFSWVVILSWIQGSYYFLTGVWPLVSMETFKWVTGERGKTDHLATGLNVDHWLIVTVAVLILAISLSILAAAWRRRAVFEVAVLGMAAATGLAIVDVFYVTRGIIEPIYLVDAVLQAVFIVAWGSRLLQPRSL